MISLLLIVFGFIALALTLVQSKRKKAHYDYLTQFSKTVYVNSMAEQQAINIKSLTDRSLIDKIKLRWINTEKQIGQYASLKIAIYIGVLIIFSWKFNQGFIRGSLIIVALFIVTIGIILGYLWLEKRERIQFEESFPDALNMLTSAVSAGESITHAIMYVGNTLSNEVGKEFKIMGKRLQLGESPDDVFHKSCQRFPYASFMFFVITLRANMQRGGQLKEVMLRLNRLMFNARSVEKKKYALTSEARTSAKIVAAIPFFFLFILQYLSPDNFEFVMFHPSGRPILYYVLISEIIGILIVWGLMKSVR